jgi:gas vesicle protein
MLTYLLAFAVAFGSLALYLAAFLYPEIHRKGDLVWSGVGLFYALVIWVCAKQITGGLLLGQMAGAALLGWFAWQTVNFRWQEKSPAQSLVAGFSLGDLKQRASTGFTQENLTKATSELQTFVGGLSTQVQGVLNKSGASGPSTGANSTPDQPLTTADFGNPPVGQSDKPGIFDSLKSLATGGLNSAKNKANYVRQTAQDKASDLAGKASDAVEKTADTVVAKMDDVKAAASDGAAAVGDQVEKVADKTADTAQKAADVVTDATNKAIETTVEVVQDGADTVVDKLKE